MIRFVLLDLDDTILDFHKAEAIALSGTLQALGIEPTPERIALYSRINAAQWRRLEAGELTRAEVLTTRFHLFFEEIGVMRSCDETQREYEARLSQGHYLISVHTLTYQRLPILAYFCRDIINLIFKPEKGQKLTLYFQDIFISEQIGADKPSSLFFERCFARIPEFSRAQAIIVGDSPTSDIQGGINAGIRTCWFNPRNLAPSAEHPADHEIHTLYELGPLLRRIP